MRKSGIGGRDGREESREKCRKSGGGGSEGRDLQLGSEEKYSRCLASSQSITQFTSQSG